MIKSLRWQPRDNLRFLAILGPEPTDQSVSPVPRKDSFCKTNEASSLVMFFISSHSNFFIFNGPCTEGRGIHTNFSGTVGQPRVLT